MTAAESVAPWGADVLRWAAYSPAHKVELMSHAVRGTDGRFVVFDPIPLEGPACAELPEAHRITAIVLTNANHERAAQRWRERWGCPVLGPADVSWDVEGIGVAGDVLPGGWRAVPLPGGAPGETAWRLDAAGLVVFGDAVVNLAGRGLELLPSRYCTDPARLKAAVEALVREGFQRALFAHGDPIDADASGRIRRMLESI